MLQASEKLVSSSAERSLLIYMITVLVVVTGLVILFFIVFQKRKNKLLLDRIKREREFEEELVKTQSEIQEQTLKNVGQELHDNVGQLLSVANMQLSLIASLAEDSIKTKVDDTKNIVANVIKEVRGLSKVLNREVIINFGLEESLNTEMERLNRMDSIKAELTCVGDKGVFKNNGDAIILFRILQEFISNTIKYSKANTLTIRLNYFPDYLVVIAEDNGVGFDIESVEKGSGLINMQNRAALIKTEFNLSSKPNEGTKLNLNYPML
mgnify:FL=1